MKIEGPRISVLLLGLTLTMPLFSVEKQWLRSPHPLLFVEKGSVAELVAENKEEVKKEPVESSVNTRELPSRLQVGVDYTRVHFGPHDHTSFNGNLGGLQGLYEYRPMNRFYGAAKLAWKEGNTHGPAGKRTLLYIDTQERVGYTFAFDQNNWMLTLFTGLGFRHLGQKFTPKHGKDLKFRYDEFYAPVGALADYTVNSWFSAGVGFIWMPQIYPSVSIVPLKGARWMLTNTLANFSVEVPLAFTVSKNKRCLLVFKPFYERWENGNTFAKTSSGQHLHLPGNTYDFWGADLNFMYRF